MSIDGAKLPVGVGPLIPDRDAAFFQPRNVRVATQEPQQFIDDRADMDLFRRHQGEALREVEPHLASEQTPRANAGTVIPVDAVVEDFVEQLQIRTHETQTEKKAAEKRFIRFSFLRRRRNLLAEMGPI